MKEITVNSKRRQEVIDITEKIRELVQESQVNEGICVIYIPHASAGLIINENDEEPGQPLVLKTNIITVNYSVISIGMTLEGKIGEKYIAGALKNGVRQSEPQFNIVDENGEVLTSGKFEYG